MNHKAGFVSIIGKPNVGKSTLMNALLGEKLSVVNPKAQTTRHRIKGILSGEDYQIVFSDTPGILKPHYKLHESMMKQVEEAAEDADIIVFITDPENAVEVALPDTLHLRDDQKLIIVINKVDTRTQEEIQSLINLWQTKFPHARIIPVSALYRFNLDTLLEAIKECLPEHPPYYPSDELTDRSVRFFVSEIIREKILSLYRREVPYSVEVVVDEFKEDVDITRIRALIYVARESQRMIIIGREGRAIKQLGIEARKEIEEFLDSKVYLELSVKVAKDWRDNEKILKRFGYEL